MLQRFCSGFITYPGMILCRRKDSAFKRRSYYTAIRFYEVNDLKEGSMPPRGRLRIPRCNWAKVPRRRSHYDGGVPLLPSHNGGVTGRDINDIARSCWVLIARWQALGSLSIACNSLNLHMHCIRVRNFAAQFYKLSVCRMMEYQERSGGRITRSQTANPMEKGKSPVGETMRKAFIDIQGDSDEEWDVTKCFAEEAPRRGGKGKVGMGKPPMRTVENSEDDSEDWSDVERGRGGDMRGRGPQRRRGRPAGRGGCGHRTANQYVDTGEGAASEGRGHKRGKKDLRRRLQEAEAAYVVDTHPNIRKMIEQMEDEALQGYSEPELDDWEQYLPDPGHTRGRMSLYKQSLHVYWGMKRLLAKAMEQVALEMAELIQGIPTMKKELKNIQIILMMQEKKMDDIVQLLQAGGLGVKLEKEGPEDPKQ